jgi:hypothetical protein
VSPVRIDALVWRRIIFIIVFEEEVLPPKQLTVARNETFDGLSARFMAFIERRMMRFSTHTAGKVCGHKRVQMHAKSRQE